MAKNKYVVLRWQMIQGPMSSCALFTWGIRLGEVQNELLMNITNVIRTYSVVCFVIANQELNQEERQRIAVRDLKRAKSYNTMDFDDCC